MIQGKVDPPKPHVIHSGVQNPPPTEWKPFEWSEPKLGKQIHGEVTVARSFGATGGYLLASGELVRPHQVLRQMALTS